MQFAAISGMKCLKLVGEKLGWARVPPGSRTSTYTELPEYEAISKSYGPLTLQSITNATPDKPTVLLEAPRDPDRVSAFLNIRVADIHAVYDEWRARGAEFLTPPVDMGRELRCYLRDPDGHLIEVGQTTVRPG